MHIPLERYLSALQDCLLTARAGALPSQGIGSKFFFPGEDFPRFARQSSISPENSRINRNRLIYMMQNMVFFRYSLCWNFRLPPGQLDEIGRNNNFMEFSEIAWNFILKMMLRWTLTKQLLKLGLCDLYGWMEASAAQVLFLLKICLSIPCWVELWTIRPLCTM